MVTAENPYRQRVALIGDMVVSRLYKDGIYSAYLTASALVETVIETNTDVVGLRKFYLPAIKRFRLDNQFGIAHILFTSMSVLILL